MTNVAVVVLDTLRYDTFSEYFSWMEGIWFNNAWSTSHWTGPAHASLLTGRYPTEINTTVKSRSLTCQMPLIAEDLQNADYTTRMISTNLQIFVWDGWDRGFEERFGPNSKEVNTIPEGIVDWQAFHEETNTTGVTKYLLGVIQSLKPKYRTIQSLHEGYRLATGQATVPSNQAVANRLDTFDIGDNEFLLINIMDMHAPYYPPKSYRSINRKVKPEIEDALAGDIENSNEIQQAYDDCARYLSDAYQSLHSKLLNDYEYVITLSDHGEHLGEGGLWTHSYGLRPELTHIPLVISGEDINNKNISVPVSIIDVHKTIANLAGIEVNSRGQSLVDDPQPVDRLIEYHGLSQKRRENIADKGIASEFNWRDEPLDAIIASEGYAFDTHKEGLEVHGKWSTDEARERLDTLIKSIDRQPLQSDESDTSKSIQRQLEALGYV